MSVDYRDPTASKDPGESIASMTSAPRKQTVGTQHHKPGLDKYTAATTDNVYQDGSAADEPDLPYANGETLAEDHPFIQFKCDAVRKTLEEFSLWKARRRELNAERAQRSVYMDYGYWTACPAGEDAMRGDEAGKGKGKQEDAASPLPDEDDNESVASPPPQSDYFPGWTPEATFDWASEITGGDDGVKGKGKAAGDGAASCDGVDIGAGDLNGTRRDGDGK